MAKRQKAFRSAIEYCAARVMVFTLARIPWFAAGWFGRRLGDLLLLLDSRHRRRAHDQVRDRLGLEGKELTRFVRRNFRHYGMTMVEFARLSRMHPEDFHKFIDLEEIRGRLEEARAGGKGLILVTAHFGNWEWCNSTARSLGVGGGSIARPLDNPRVNEFVRSIRERNGLRIFDKTGAIRKAMGSLRNNELMGVLIDQDAGKQGMMSPFLGKPASTITIPVELAIRIGSPMVVVGLKRNARGEGGGKRFTILLGPTRRARAGADKEEETRRLVDELNNDLGGLIMKAPEQWFWIHRRWKSVGAK